MQFSNDPKSSFTERSKSWDSINLNNSKQKKSKCQKKTFQRWMINPQELIKYKFLGYFYPTPEHSFINTLLLGIKNVFWLKR